MLPAAEPSHGPDVVMDSDAILERARTGTRLMTLRGVAMRTISIGANLLLLLLVSPAELGLFAVARGTLALLQYVAELGIGKALVRRREVPTSAEYAALSGLQIMVGILITLAGAVFPAVILGFGAIDARWHAAMVVTVATMLSLAFGTGARVRLERGLAYERLAIIDVFNVLTLNLGLVIFAALGRFSIGVFVLLGVASVAANVLLWVWAPGPRPSFDLRPLAGVARQSTGFLVASTCTVAREQGTAVLVGALFGLPAAGLFSFAERVAQVLNITF
ncbi:MAG: oligosaccharide flippase family protein, partial [Cytophagaceae bacterium]|nr:oligosaccharide flippase family protein [Gemmatimonadaceae bacterium]